ncbi:MULTISPECIES: acyl-CoA desaturase [unclassified Streptomyces]|uniref:fatty acid desaturase family protein n=1 Tax=unclassified Streptomyces TaxID=2593676 RepID=UPI002DD840A8|nr:acyl-CoA desaturase [Streptomyces sp. NBC_01750]WSA98561.1 acyl-CoA desaturase [Streptomyces sp. NBC_01794]WSD36903.1 acyl-CoA desaturase [Streptomyces sp. NBC_01750]
MPQATVTLAAPAPAPTASGGRAASGAGSEFAPLLRTVKEQGLLERRTGWYARGITVNLLGITALVTGMALLGGSWWVLLLAPLLAVLSARTAFFGHDAGHAQITGDRRKSRIIQLIHANLLLGMSQEWWNDKHNRHHANPNHIEKDPDVAADILVFTQKQARGRVGFRGWLTRHQSWLFFPLTTLEGIALKIYGFRAVFSREAGARQTTRERAVEGLLLLTHAAAYVTLLLTTMSVGKAVVFALIHQMLLGLHLGMAFAPNHKGMEMPDEESGRRWGHLRRQVLTSRNVRGGPVTDWFLGGLNYQIEHHLFPSMPRPHLRLAQPLVRAHCRSLGITYTETCLLDSYRQALSHMREVGEPLRSDA